MTAWSASQYLKFEGERSRPARDLLAAISLATAKHVVDLGCGPGSSTELLTGRFPTSTITGIDTSADMLATARQRLPNLTFVSADIADWMPAEPVDLLFANAVFQWVPDHLAVMARLMTALKPGGVLAIQMPDNLDEPSHMLMREVAFAGPWAPKYAEPIPREQIGSPRQYYDRLKPLSSRVDIWRTIYHHTLEEPDAIVEWVKSTGLRPYLDRLDKAETEAWLSTYQRRLADAYPPLGDGRVLFRFPRLFIVAVRESGRGKHRESGTSRRYIFSASAIRLGTPIPSSLHPFSGGLFVMGVDRPPL